MYRALSKHLWIGPIFVVAATIRVTGMANAEGPISSDAYERCRTISDDKARLHCFENLTSPRPQNPSSPAEAVPFGSQKMPNLPPDPTFGSQTVSTSLPIAGKWRLVRTPNPREGQDIVSIMATAELSGSDIDFAGLNLRCADQNFQVLVFLVRPLPPRARPTISMNGKTFEGSVVPPGTAVLLPKTASVLAREQWQSLPSLAIEVEDDGTKTHGLVSLTGFANALQTLFASCSTR
jgi:hypothetical protein